MLIAIEGIDGSGKGLQASLLKRRLERAGKSVQLFRFPRYSETFFGQEIGRYLDGQYGNIDQVPARLTSLLYALDRFESLDAIQQAVKQGHIVICDRYVGSNMAHQGARVPPTARGELMSWIRTVEVEVLKLREPDAVFFLDMPVATAQSLVGKKEARPYTDKTFDLHEASEGHLTDALENFKLIAASEGWLSVPCTDSRGLLRDPESINDDIFAALSCLDAR